MIHQCKLTYFFRLDICVMLRLAALRGMTRPRTGHRLRAIFWASDLRIHFKNLDMGYGISKGGVVVPTLGNPPQEYFWQAKSRSKPAVNGGGGSPKMPVKATEAHRRASDSISTNILTCEGETGP